MAEEKPRSQEPEWLNKICEPDSMRNYRPVDGPEEPAQPPQGRASTSAASGTDNGDVLKAPDGGEAGDAGSRDT